MNNLSPRYTEHGLLPRFIGFNLFGLVALTFFYLEGWLTKIVYADVSYLSIVIFGFFFVNLILSCYKAHKLSQLFKKIDFLKTHYKNASNEKLESFKLKLNAGVSAIFVNANISATLGLLGTVIGILLAINSIEPGALSSPETGGQAIEGMMAGAGVAFYTTLVGGVSYLWLLVNHFMLRQGASLLYAYSVDDDPPQLKVYRSIFQRVASAIGNLLSRKKPEVKTPVTARKTTKKKVTKKRTPRTQSTGAK